MSITEPNFIVLKGKTGSGKTAILNYLSSLHYPVIVTEQIAGHKGSVFGALGKNGLQPSQQVFEKSLSGIYDQYHIHSFIFTEHKSGSIGKRKIPTWFYKKMEDGYAIELHVPKTQRAENILEEYMSCPVKDTDILHAIDKLSGRLSEEKVLLLKELISKKKYLLFVNEILDYYDTSFQYNSNSTNRGIDIFIEKNYSIKDIAENIINSLHVNDIMIF
jgi:tRNA 2-selenouridine synthase